MRRLNGHEFVPIEAGFSCIGSDEIDPFASDKEKPLREVYISAFQISKYPTTNLQIYQFFCSSGVRPDVRWGQIIDGSYPASLRGREDHPATFVSWEIASAYCKWLSDQSGENVVLPSEAEWEKAARGGGARIWPWGNIFDKDLCNCAESGRNDFCSVYDYVNGASPYGCMHMAGGVWEWCVDFHILSGHNTLSVVNPINLRPSPQRVVKGGSAFCTKEIVRPACRDWTNSVNQGGGDDGMRIVIRQT